MKKYKRHLTIEPDGYFVTIAPIDYDAELNYIDGDFLLPGANKCRWDHFPVRVIKTIPLCDLCDRCIERMAGE